jgi:hypothetical protein
MLLLWVIGSQECDYGCEPGDEVRFCCERNLVKLRVREQNVPGLNGVVAKVGDTVSHSFVPHGELFEWESLSYGVVVSVSDGIL